MAPHQQPKSAVVALFLAALVLASPAAAYRPEAGYAPSTPAAEVAPTEPAVSTPTEASTPAESGTPVANGYKPAAAASTPAEETPTEAAVSTPTEASTPAEETTTDAAVSTPTDASTPAEETPTDAAVSASADAGYKPGEATSTPAEATPTEAAVSTPAEAGTPVAAGYTPAAEKSGKATTEDQKLMEVVNAAYKKALEAANAAAPDDKFPVFDAAFDKGIKAGLTEKTEAERGVFTGLVDKAVKDAYVSTSAAAVASEEERFSLFVFTLTEALRVMAATLETHAVKPAAEEAVAGGAKAPVVEQEVIGKIDAAVKVAAAAAKEAPSTDKFLVFEATFSKAFKDAMGPAYDENKAVPQLNAAYKEAYEASVAAGPKAKFDAFREALTDAITAMGKAVKAGTATKPAAEASTEPAAEAAYKPAAEATTEPAAEATTEPAAETATKPAAAKPKAAGAGTVGGYNV